MKLFYVRGPAVRLKSISFSARTAFHWIYCYLAAYEWAFAFAHQAGARAWSCVCISVDRASNLAQKKQQQQQSNEKKKAFMWPAGPLGIDVNSIKNRNHFQSIKLLRLHQCHNVISITEAHTNQPRQHLLLLLHFHSSLLVFLPSKCPIRLPCIGHSVASILKCNVCILCVLIARISFRSRSGVWVQHTELHL